MAIIGKEKAGFRVQIYDLENKKTKTISLIKNGFKLEGLKEIIEEAIEAAEK